jgi:hypothetical protein
LLDELLDLLERRGPPTTFADVGHHHAPAVLPHRQTDEVLAVGPKEQVVRAVAGAVEGDVGQQEVLRVGLPFEAQAELVAHPAVCAVAADP